MVAEELHADSVDHHADDPRETRRGGHNLAHEQPGQGNQYTARDEERQALLPFEARFAKSRSIRKERSAGGLYSVSSLCRVSSLTSVLDRISHPPAAAMKSPSWTVPRFEKFNGRRAHQSPQPDGSRISPDLMTTLYLIVGFSTRAHHAKRPVRQARASRRWNDLRYELHVGGLHMVCA